MDAARRAAIRQRCEKATPGPWEARAREAFKTLADEDYFSGFEVDGPPNAIRGEYERGADADFVAAARTDVPDLLAALDQAEQENARLREALSELFAYAGEVEQYAVGARVGRGDWLNDSLPRTAEARQALGERVRAALGEAAPAGEE